MAAPLRSRATRRKAWRVRKVPEAGGGGPHRRAGPHLVEIRGPRPSRGSGTDESTTAPTWLRRRRPTHITGPGEARAAEASAARLTVARSTASTPTTTMRIFLTSWRPNKPAIEGCGKSPGSARSRPQRGHAGAARALWPKQGDQRPQERLAHRNAPRSTGRQGPASIMAGARHCRFGRRLHDLDECAHWSRTLRQRSPFRRVPRAPFP